MSNLPPMLCGKPSAAAAEFVPLQRLMNVRATRTALAGTPSIPNRNKSILVMGRDDLDLRDDGPTQYDCVEGIRFAVRYA
jgi:hypothetical protein